MTNVKREHEFRKKFNQMLKGATLLTTAYDAFTRANIDAQILHNNIETLDSALISSLSRSLPITYAKPFLTTKDVDATAIMSKKYLTTSDDFDNELHTSLMELRNVQIAHANSSFEINDSRVIVSVVNSDTGDPDVKRVYIPKCLFYINNGFLSFNNDKDLLSRIEKHTHTAAKLTLNEMNVKAKAILDLMIEYADVCYISDKVIIQEPTDPIPDATDVFQIDNPELKNGNCQRTNAIARVAFPLENINYSNEYFTIKSIADENNEGTYHFNVQFKNI